MWYSGSSIITHDHGKTANCDGQLCFGELSNRKQILFSGQLAVQKLLEDTLQQENSAVLKLLQH